MIKSKFINTDDAPFPYAAIRDASMRNAVGKTHFSAGEQRKAQNMMFALETCYRAHDTHINWRYGGSIRKCPKFAALKLDNPTVVDRKNLNILENGWKTDPMLKRIEKRMSRQGIIYKVYF
jgi:hypothetical protein